ncbi:response regulator transcription factor [Pelomonas cellulosilytica]|uniref:Response regulator transcription factor n=1 Tax=Pelomonas cellulosilytica TaxID=2906762 RepID=A0ABS8XV77_9BURK|nr:response regulator transcription factor [Pelomonas sp. P8]MCE4556562.1 response regulator transcription factor [Pelomonas sp. P8]
MLIPTAIHVRVTHPEPLVHRGILATLSADSRFQVDERGPDEPSFPDLSPPQVLITDLPFGITAVLQRTATPAVLVLSHLDGELSIRGALQHGVKGYLTHDCLPEQLVDAVMMLARGQRYLQGSVVQRLADTLSQDLPTPREGDVLRLMATGLCNKAIAAELNIGCGTVKTHVKALLDKLGAQTRTAAADIAKRRGLLDPVAASLASDRLVRRRGGHAGRHLQASAHALA